MIPAPSFIDAETWAAYCEMRKAMPRNIPFTDAAAKMVIRKLVQFHGQGYDVDYILTEATIGSWRSVYVPNECPMRNVEIERTREFLAQQTQAAEASQTPQAKMARDMALGAIKGMTGARR